ncbi:hypothetical protein Aph02nite_40720 [Actinoplanes philippinensis]|nr:hypothetical protein Aph02nite_40720 [Actinoplanes philippinensis]
MTVVGPSARADLSIPVDVPLANLLPTLLRYVGERLADEGVAKGGWVLTRLGGAVLDESRTATELAIRDGEMLYFAPPGNPVGDMVFDDVVDAVATATRNRPGNWAAADTRRFGLIAAVAALVAGALVLLTSRPLTVAGAVGLGIAAVLVGAAATLTRAFRERVAGTALGLVALVYAAIGGTLVLGGDRGLDELTAPDLLIGAGALVLFTALASVATGQHTGVFVGALGAGVALGAGAGISFGFGAPPAAGAAVVAAITLAVIPALPLFSYRLARMPIPSVPSGPEDLRADVDTVDGLRLLAQSDRANEILTGLITTVAVLLLGAEVVLGLTAGLPATLLCGLLAVLVMLRARPHEGRAQRWPLLVAGVLGLALFVYAAFATGNSAVRLFVLPVGLLAAAVGALATGRTLSRRKVSPVWGRLLDIGEIILIILVVPAVVWVCGLLTWIRAIKG